MKSVKHISSRLVAVCSCILIISCSTPELIDQNSQIDSVQLNEAFSQALHIGNLISLVVFQNEGIVKEEYYGSGDAVIPHDVRSVTKSVIGILVGIAIDKGYLQSKEQTIGTFINPLVENLGEEKANITIEHLLTMSSGFEWDELVSVSGYNSWISSANQIQYLCEKPLISPPGQTFTYNSAALHLLSVILTRASGINTLDFAQQYLFDPLGSGEREWQMDHQDYYNGGAGLKITPHDMIKIGQLILDRGEYKGKRIVSSQWINQLMSTKIQTNNAVPFGPGYGYCWWTGSNSKGNYVFANGWGGQFIVVVPNSRLIVVATNQWSGVDTSTANDQWYRTLNLILTRILPAVK